MIKRLSDSENIVIREIFKNPDITLKKIGSVLEKAKDRQTRKSDSEVDVRTVSKFKSVGLKKIKQGLEELADTLRLDRSVQGETKEEQTISCGTSHVELEEVLQAWEKPLESVFPTKADISKDDVIDKVSIEGCVRERNSYGGTSYKEVKRQISRAKQEL